MVNHIDSRTTTYSILVSNKKTGGSVEADFALEMGKSAIGVKLNPESLAITFLTPKEGF